MNKLPILAVALVPFMAMAAPTDSDKSQDRMQSQARPQATSQAKVDKQKLQQATPVTALLDEEVFSQQGEEIGNVDDVIVSRDGKVKSFIVDADVQNMEISGRDKSRDMSRADREDGMDSDLESDVEAGWEEAEATTERSAENARTSLPGQGEMRVQPRDVKYDPKQGRVTVDPRKLQASADDYSDGSEMRLEEVVGMEVNLQDEDSFGRVEDVMLSKDNTEVVALVVDNWDGLEKHRRALPISQAQFNSEEDEITLSMNLADVENLPDFNLDKYTDEGWDLANWMD